MYQIKENNHSAIDVAGRSHTPPQLSVCACLHHDKDQGIWHFMIRAPARLLKWRKVVGIWELGVPITIGSPMYSQSKIRWLAGSIASNPASWKKVRMSWSLALTGPFIHTPRVEKRSR